jgi:hypothetical protein
MCRHLLFVEGAIQGQEVDKFTVSGLTSSKAQCNYRIACERPYVDLTVGEAETVKSLFDTGAAVSLMQRQVFRMVRAFGAVVAQLEHTLKVTTADGATMPVDGVYVISFTLLGKKRMAATRFCILSLVAC